MSDDPSPDVLASTGVKRLNKKPLIIVIGIGLFVALALAYAVSARAKAQRKAAPTDAQAEQTHSVQTTDNTVKDITKNMPEAGDVPSSVALQSPAPLGAATIPSKLLDAGNNAVVPPPGAVVLGAPARGTALPAQKTPEQKAEEDWLVAYRLAQQKRWQTYEAAVAATPRVNTQQTAKGVTTSAGANMPSMDSLNTALASANGRRSDLQRQQSAMMSKLANMSSGSGGDAAGTGAGDSSNAYADANGQDEKDAWTEKVANPNKLTNYLMASRTKPLSPLEIKQGTVIPAIMISGVNSDLPGQLIAQISQDVWDTATGQYLLIPQGSKLFGVYDSHVTYGQNRVLVAWTRIIYPDGSALDLGGMSGVDQAGYSGFKDRVNHHYARIFGSAILMSGIGIAPMLAAGDDQNAYVTTAKERATTQFAADMASVSKSIIQKNLNIQPTIEIRPGYRFNVMVNKDVIFPETYTK